MTKIVVRYLENGKVERQEFDDIDRARALYSRLEQNRSIKMADLEVETVTTLKAFTR